MKNDLEVQSVGQLMQRRAHWLRMQKCPYNAGCESAIRVTLKVITEELARRSDGSVLQSLMGE